MKKLVLLFFCVLSLLSASAADHETSVRTSVDKGRYEIVQSGISRRLTFLLDKYTGDVYHNELDKLVWRKMIRIGESKDASPQTKINYQLFLGGISARDVFLLNINTGQTWHLYQDTDTEELFFSLSRGLSDI